MALTLTTEAEIIRRAGVGASTAITGVSATVVAIGEVAEGDLIAETKWNMITNYANINASIKKAISEAVACKAAMEIVAYDRKGYFSTTEWQTLLDILYDNYRKAVDVLKQDGFNTIRSIA
ncbi:MAG: hypothetical protein HC874_27300 [Richelia sp. SL_2_1]|nr:hypothetical protein [Richelia sp. SL_2_1]